MHARRLPFFWIKKCYNAQYKTIISFVERNVFLKSSALAICCYIICLIHRPGCFCPPGLLVGPNNTCITRDQCPENATQSPAERCQAQGRIYKTCGTACPPTCDQPGPRICTRQCVRGEATTLPDFFERARRLSQLSNIFCRERSVLLICLLSV